MILALLISFFDLCLVKFGQAFPAPDLGLGPLPPAATVSSSTNGSTGQFIAQHGAAVHQAAINHFAVDPTAMHVAEIKAFFMYCFDLSYFLPVESYVAVALLGILLFDTAMGLSIFKLAVNWLRGAGG